MEDAAAGVHVRQERISVHSWGTVGPEAAPIISIDGEASNFQECSARTWAICLLLAARPNNIVNEID
jgi:hypothetical protein